eukprot:10471090-Alexandrium_andersonii.AAC.1
MLEECINRVLFHAKTRRGVPKGEVPSEVWRLALYPDWHRVGFAPRWGIGHCATYSPPDTIRNWMSVLWAVILSSSCAPNQFLVNSGFYVHKKAMPHICEASYAQGLRTVHCYASLPQALFRPSIG